MKITKSQLKEEIKKIMKEGGHVYDRLIFFIQEIPTKNRYHSNQSISLTIEKLNTQKSGFKDEDNTYSLSLYFAGSRISYYAKNKEDLQTIISDLTTGFHRLDSKVKSIL